MQRVPADLFIGKELDRRIGHNPDAVGAIPLEHACDALFAIHVFATLQWQLFMVSHCNNTATLV